MFTSTFSLQRIFFIGTLVLLSVLSNTSRAQTKTEIFTNQTVISLVKAGLDNGTIVTTINNANNKFDVSSQGLINLKKQGVPNEVIAAMVERKNESPKPAGQTTVASAEVATGKKPGKYKIDLINHPYAHTVGASAVNALEKNSANIATRSKMMGYGGVTSQYEIAGLKAAVRKPITDSLVFLVNTSGAAPEFVLYKAKVAKDKRAAATFSAGTFQAAKSGNNTISFNILPESNGVFRLAPSQKLEKGEYFFAGKNIGSSAAIDVYAFGID